MTRLRNIRQTAGRHGPEMTADFTIVDGRMGSVSIPLSTFEQHGERALQEQASACERQALAHGYRPPGVDRYRELG